MQKYLHLTLKNANGFCLKDVASKHHYLNEYIDIFFVGGKIKFQSDTSFVKYSEPRLSTNTIGSMKKTIDATPHV